MKVIRATQQMLETRTLVLGFQGENLRTQLRVDCSPTFAEYPNATPALAIKSPTGETYPVFVERDGNEVVWNIVANNLALKGDGELQLTFYKDNVIAKTSIGHITVNRSLQIDGEMPDVVATWIENANRKLAEVDAQIVELEGMVDTATDAATRAEQSASTASTKAEQAAGSAATATAKATEATNAAGTATAKAAEAALSATQANNSAVSAAGSESGATAKAAEAAQSAQTAAQKAEQITEAAQIATGKAEEASASAQSAHASATDAASSATAASASETAAKASATQAAQSEQNAGTAAQTATQKAAEATQSASNAAASATNAATSAETASTKAGEAAQSAQAVEETAEQLADSLEQISQNTQDIADHEQYAEATYAKKTDLYKKADVIHSTASGAIASFADGAEMPVDEVTAQINPVQDLHGYENPWPAGGGVNKIDINKLKSYGTTYGLTVSFDGDWIVLSGEYTNTTQVANFRIANLKDGSVFPVTKFKAFPDSNTSSHMTSAPFGLADGNKTLTIYISGMVQGETYNLRFKIVGYEGDTAPTEWTPYSNICPITGWTAAQIVVSPTTDAADGQTYSITLPTEAGTVYGGSLTIAEDGSGVLTVDRFLYVYDGTESFAKSSTALNGFYNNLQGTNWQLPHSWPSMINYGYGVAISTEISSMFAVTKNADEYKTNYGRCFLDSGMNFNVPPELFGTTVESFRAKLAELYAAGTPVSVFAKIATPITYTLTAPEITTLLGENNVWADTGDVSVKYNADTKLYIDNKIAELIARIVNS